MTERRRRTDYLGVAGLAISLIVAAVIAVTGLPAVLDTSERTTEIEALTKRITQEGRVRRDQMCRLFERQHLGDVKRLHRTYAFLSQLPREDWGTSLTVAIIRQLPETEREARSDRAPRFCNAAGIGLPEPDLEPPPHRDFSRLLQRQRP